MTFRNTLATSALSLGICLLAAQAQAITTPGATIQNPLSGLDSSSAIMQGKGKVKKAKVNEFGGVFAGDTWSLLDRTNRDSKIFNDGKFELSADTGSRSGDWEVSWDGSAMPDYMDYVLVLKSGKQWSAFLFQSAGTIVEPQKIGGTFGIDWYNKKGKISKLRHATLFGRSGNAPMESQPPGLPVPGPIGVVPAEVASPGTLALLLIGLVLALRQSKQQF